jgi:hypothetical protein
MFLLTRPHPGQNNLGEGTAGTGSGSDGGNLGSPLWPVCTLPEGIEKATGREGKLPHLTFPPTRIAQTKTCLRCMTVCVAGQTRRARRRHIAPHKRLSLSLLPSLTQPLSSEQSSCCIPSPGRRSTDAGVSDQGASSACGRAMAFPRVCASVALLVVAFSCLMPASGQCTRLTGRHILFGLKRLVLAGSDVRPVLIFFPLHKQIIIIRGVAFFSCEYMVDLVGWKEILVSHHF